VVASPIAAGYWIANTATSKWIAPAMAEGYPTGGTPHPAGTYTYRLTFDLTGIDPNTVTIGGYAGVDNVGAIKLNGAALAMGIPSYNPLTSFSAHAGFVPGVNHLDFVVTNYSASGSNPTGLRVSGLTGTGTATTAVGSGAAPQELELLAPWPNPATRQSRIAFALPQGTHLRLRVVDLAGRTVRTLVDRDVVAGRHEVVWDGVNDAGAPSRAGVYFVELDAGGRHISRRMAWTR
jgi:hypothetical protein